MRAAAMASSQPAWPAPTTTTSYCSVKLIFYLHFTGQFSPQRHPFDSPTAAGSLRAGYGTEVLGAAICRVRRGQLESLCFSYQIGFPARLREDHHCYLSRLI